MSVIDSLPANELIAAGIRDLQADKQTIPALLVAVGAPRLRSLGVAVPSSQIEDQLYKYPAIDSKSFRLSIERFLQSL